MKVGTKELKNGLSHFLRRVRDGETVYVTDRGEVIAEIRKVAASRGGEERRLRDMAARGLLALGGARFRDFEPVRLKKGARLSDAILEDRG